LDPAANHRLAQRLWIAEKALAFSAGSRSASWQKTSPNPLRKSPGFRPGSLGHITPTRFKEEDEAGYDIDFIAEVMENRGIQVLADPR
jgi:hypothetical protein